MAEYFPVSNFGRKTILKESFPEGYQFLNQYPMDVHLYYIPRFQTSHHKLASLNKGETRIILNTEDGIPIGPGGVVQSYIYIEGKLTLSTDGLILKEMQRNVIVGGVSYNDLGDVLSIVLYKPINGVKIYNDFCLPIDVYYKGDKVGSIIRSQPDDSAQLYFDNYHNGLDLHDELTFCIAGTKKILNIAILNDKYTKNIHVGTITAF